MQCVVIEYARNVASLGGAHSSELIPDTTYPVIDLMLDQKDVQDMGVQFHPEFLSRPNRPHPLFKDFVEASLKVQE